MYLVKTPQFIQGLFPHCTWKIPVEGKKIFLTFDDGPIPEATPWVVDQLAAFDAKATFFSVGENIVKHPDVHQMVLDNGHSIGNHTFNHLNGWQSENVDYFRNVRHCARVAKTLLFRPPYGKLKPKQAEFLQRHYRIVMWDVLSGDFDQSISSEQCLKNVLSNAKSGSIVVFHDSLKALDKLTYALPRVLEHFADLGYQFGKLNMQQLIRRREPEKQIA